MKPWQTAVRYCAIIFAVILIVNIASWGLRLLGVVLGAAYSGTLDEAKVYEFDADTDRLDIDISAAKLIIRFEKCDAVTVKSNLKGVSVAERWGKLKIDDNRISVSVKESEGFVEIMIPEGMILREIDLDLGAGKTVLSSINAEEVDIDGGAGELLISRCVISELDLDMGVGALVFSGMITEKADMSLGVGTAEITLLGGRDSYRLELERGLGKITVDGEEVGNGRIGNGTVRVDVDGGVGSIQVEFE